MIRLAQWLKDTGRTIDGFAAEIGKSRQAVHRYLNGSRFPQPDTIRRIEDISGGAVPASSWYERSSAPEAAE